MVDIVELAIPFSDRTDPELVFNTRSGGEAIDGTEQILSPLSERWRFTAVFPITNATAARAARVVKSKLKGRFNYLLLRMCDQYRISRNDVGGTYPTDSVPHSDGTYFSDGSGHALAQPNAPIMADANANAVQISVRASDFAGAMVAGVFFSVNYWLYQVDGWELDGDNYILDISPPLREAVTTNDTADFDAKCLWRLVGDQEGQLPLQLGKFGTMTLNLVEPIGR